MKATDRISLTRSQRVKKEKKRPLKKRKGTRKQNKTKNGSRNKAHLLCTVLRLWTRRKKEGKCQ